MILVLETPVRKVFLISLALSPIVTEAQNIIDFTFVGTNPQREALTYTRSWQNPWQNPAPWSLINTLYATLFLVFSAWYITH